MDPPQPQTLKKIRVMCSYGGQITPLPHQKSLCYSGGDNRIISVPADTTANISSFSAHIAAVLHVGYPFTLKYQLPFHDLDSLISLSSDDDLQIFLEEQQRLSSSPAPARIRLFLFPVKQQRQAGEFLVSSAENELTTKSQSGLMTHPKTESWFSDALKSAKMMQKGVNLGFGGGEGQIEGGICGQESMALETTSSFGSTSSSISSSNLPAVKTGGDETLTSLVESKTKLPSAESVASDISSVTSAMSQVQSGNYQDLAVPIPATENKVYLNLPESSNTKVSDPAFTGVQYGGSVQTSGYPLSSQIDPLQRQQIQFIPIAHTYMPQNLPGGALPASSYYPVFSTLPPHQQQLQYLPNQSYPVYMVPVGQNQIYSSSVPSGRPPVHPNTPMISPQVVYKEVVAAPPIPNFVSQVYRTTPSDSSLHCAESKQQSVVAPQTHNQPPETVNYGNENEEDAAHAQIYKSQPPPPTLPSQYQTMTQDATVLLSEALGQLHMENIKQQIGTSQQQ